MPKFISARLCGNSVFSCQIFAKICRLLPRPRRRHSREGGNPKCGRKSAMFNSISPKVKSPPGFNIKPKVNILDSRLRGNDGVEGRNCGGRRICRCGIGGGGGISSDFLVPTLQRGNAYRRRLAAFCRKPPSSLPNSRRLLSQNPPPLPHSARIGRRDAALHAFPRWSVGTRHHPKEGSMPSILKSVLLPMIVAVLAFIYASPAMAHKGKNAVFPAFFAVLEKNRPKLPLFWFSVRFSAYNGFLLIIRKREVCRPF
ncbi:MAG: hypothetical protein HAW59_01710 [Betaproteobacteria bacterium]|nr:hypothetical protein [Betaproteobacteria bacterium]